MRLNKYIATATGISRRQADELIDNKKVLVNGSPALMGMQVDESSDDIKVAGKILDKSTKDTTVLYYKPIFTLSSKEPENDKKTIYDTLPKSLSRLKYAGRLDYMTEGLMVLTNNGDLIQKLTHPKNNLQKVYLVALNSDMNEKDIRRIQKPIDIDGYQTKSIKVEKLTTKDAIRYKFLKLSSHKHWYKFSLAEGRTNQIRHICMENNVKVQRLARVKHGKYELTSEIKQMGYKPVETKNDKTA